MIVVDGTAAPACHKCGSTDVTDREATRCNCDHPDGAPHVFVKVYYCAPCWAAFWSALLDHVRTNNG